MTLTTSKAAVRLNPPVFPPEPSRLRKLPKDLAMRLVGRVGVGLHRIIGSRARDGLGILTYHRVTTHVPRVPAPLFNVTPRRFRDQLAGLLDRGFRFWPLAKVLQYHGDGHAVPERTVIVTFDDGFATTFSEAYPVLEEFVEAARATGVTCGLASESDGEDRGSKR